MRLLLAEDEEELSNALVAVLKAQKYTVDAVYNGLDAYDWAIATEYDGIILDIMMPYMSGLEVLEKIRKKGIDTPVLLLTAKAEIEDRVLGLDKGADDYLTKPFAMKELLARIRAMTRRNNTSFEANIIECQGLKLDRNKLTLECGDNSTVLGNKEFQMMEMLMRDGGKLVSTELFMDRIWGYDTQAQINVVWVYISYLRKKLLQMNAPCEIKAARGQGYRLALKGEDND